MKYFTFEWWQSVQTETPSNPWPAYFRHFESIRKRLPKRFIEFYDSVSLHDGRLHELNISGGSAAVRLMLADGDRLTVFYSRVECVTCIDNPMGFAAPAGFGDIGYDEIDVLSTGLFQHNWLFSSAIELSFVFRELDFNREPIQA